MSKKPPETDPDQSERFREVVRDLEAAGQLDPDDERALEKLLGDVGASRTVDPTKIRAKAE